MKAYVKIDTGFFSFCGVGNYFRISKEEKLRERKNTKMIKATKMTLNSPKWEINFVGLLTINKLLEFLI